MTSSRALLIQALAVGSAAAAALSTDNPPSSQTVTAVGPDATPAAATTSLSGVPSFTYDPAILASATKSAAPAKSSLPTCKKVQYNFAKGEGSNAERAAAVVEAYTHLWNAYETYAWGYDELQPLSLTGTNDWYGWGVTVVDGIDTAIAMGLTDIVDKQLSFIQNIDFTTTQYGAVEIFDTNIRYLGGLLSAYDMLKSGQFPNPYGEKKVEALLQQAVSLADKIAYGFNTPSGIQSSNVDFTSNTPVFSTYTIGGVTYNSTNTASFGTFILEWFRLSDLTGNQTYRNLAARSESWIINPSPAPVYPGLVGTQFDVETGKMLSFDGGWHAGCDSDFEYMIKTFQYEQSNLTTQYKDFWLTAVQSTRDYLALHPYGWDNLTFISELDESGSLTYSMDDFTNFAGGNILLGGTMLAMPDVSALGLEITDGAHATYNRTTTGLGPISWNWFNSKNEAYSSQDDLDTSFHMNNDNRGFYIPQGNENWEYRPEEVESIFYAHRITNDPRWAEYQWEIFQAINTTSRTTQAFGVVNNVDMPFGGSMGNLVDSFMYAEVLKYIYLTFADPSVIDLDHWVFNTECHPFLVQCSG